MAADSKDGTTEKQTITTIRIVDSNVKTRLRKYKFMFECTRDEKILTRLLDIVEDIGEKEIKKRFEKLFKK